MFKPNQVRPDFEVIAGWVPNSARVLDLGCGDGSLLALLKERKHVKGYGIDSDDQAVLDCLAKGVNMLQGDVQSILAEFPDHAFDCLILSCTLQATLHTEALINEMMRVGKSCIISMPNFGHFQVRWQLATQGRMPVSEKLPYEWYNTPNIHFATIRDFDDFIAKRRLKVLGRTVLADGQTITNFENLRGDLLMLHLAKK